MYLNKFPEKQVRLFLKNFMYHWFLRKAFSSFSEMLCDRGCVFQSAEFPFLSIISSKTTILNEVNNGFYYLNVNNFFTKCTLHTSCGYWFASQTVASSSWWLDDNDSTLQFEFPARGSTTGSNSYKLAYWRPIFFRSISRNLRSSGEVSHFFLHETL